MFRYIILAPFKFRNGATRIEFLGHCITPEGRSPNLNKVTALADMPMPRNVSQLRSLIGSLSYYRQYFAEPSSNSRTPYNPSEKKGGFRVYVAHGKKLYVDCLTISHGHRFWFSQTSQSLKMVHLRSDFPQILQTLGSAAR